jgi:hypothetical protein
MIWTIVAWRTLGGSNGLMKTRPTYLARFLVMLLITGLIFAAGLESAPRAFAVATSGQVSVTPAPDHTRAAATYVIARFRVPNGETVTGYTVTFPVDTYAQDATSPNASVSVAADDRTVTVTYNTPITGPANNVNLTIENVRNPSTAGTYAITQVVFHRTNGNQTVGLGGNGTYTITPAPFLSMTITTPDDGQSVDFGSIDPGVTTSGKDVILEITSSAQYTITRSAGGANGLLGLSVSGVPVNVLQPAAAATPATFTDTFTLTPPWTTDPEVPLVANITYTVTQ